MQSNFFFWKTGEILKENTTIISFFLFKGKIGLTPRNHGAAAQVHPAPSTLTSSQNTTIIGIINDAKTHFLARSVEFVIIFFLILLFYFIYPIFFS